MTLELPPLHEDLVFHGPLSEARADDLVSFMSHLDEGTVLDTGCGWAELLLRVLDANPVLSGCGVDTNASDLAHARLLAAERGLQERVTFVEGDGSAASPDSASGVICIGSSQVWGNRDQVDMDYSAALAALRAKVPHGGRVVYADAIWTVKPSPAAMEALGGSETEFVSLAELVSMAVEHGFRPFAVAEASLDEWDAFESGYGRGYERWLIAHDSADPDYEKVRDMADSHRTAWLSGYRGVLGLAYLCLVAV